MADLGKPILCGKKYSGDELLVGFGEIDSDESSCDSDNYPIMESHRRASFFGRLIGKEKKGQIKRELVHFNSVSSDLVSHNSSMLSVTTRDTLRETLQNVGKAFQKFNRQGPSDLIVKDEQFNSNDDDHSSSVIFFDLNKREVVTSTSFDESKEPNPTVEYLETNPENLTQNPETKRKSLDHLEADSSIRTMISSNLCDIESNLNRLDYSSPQLSSHVKNFNNSSTILATNEIKHIPETGENDQIQQLQQHSQPPFTEDLEHESPTTKSLLPLHETNEEKSYPNTWDTDITIDSLSIVTDQSDQNSSRYMNNKASYVSTGSSVLKQKKAVNRKNVLINPKELQSYMRKIVKKSNETKNMIYDAIKSNILFILWTKEEIFEFIDTFDELNVEKGETIFSEGDEGTYFYVLEKGSINVYKQFNLAGSIDGCGATFGDVALLYDAPRNATFSAVTDCKLWVIDRKDYRGVSRLNNKTKADQKISFLKGVKIGHHILGDVLEMSEIYNIALATQNVSFVKGEHIIKEGERGDTIYIIKTGLVDVYIKACGNKPIGTMCAGQFIGEKAILKPEGVRTATCIVTSDVVECLSLEREIFSKVLGDVKWMFDKLNEREKLLIPERRKSIEYGEGNSTNKSLRFKLGDLDVKRTIGIGAFGSVKLVKAKTELLQKNARTYVLKCQELKLIEENNMMEHIRREQKIMEALDHTFIIKFYGAVVDSKFTYFLLELLQGGELFRLLLEKNSFSEKWSQFYCGVVLSAFSEIHANNFVYRDLKPENLVLDTMGYPKIVDFGLAKKLEGGKTWTLCGTPDYMPPEIILNEGHDSAADYWSVGILLYEFSTGSPPFTSEYPMDVYKNILAGNVVMPAFISRNLQELIKKLLNPRQSTRIGRTYGGTQSIMDQEWFSTLNFDHLVQRKIQAPFIPELTDEDDMRYFYDYREFDAEKSAEHIDEKLEKPEATKKRASDGLSSVHFRDDEVNFEPKNPSKQNLSYTINKVNRHSQKMPDFSRIVDLDCEDDDSDYDIQKISNEFSSNTASRNKADSFLMIQLMNLALSENMMEHSSKHGVPFKQFSLLSIAVDTLHDLASNTNESFVEETIKYRGTRYVDPIYMHSVDVVDSFPKERKFKRRGSASHLAPEALSAFCFSDGLSIRLLPRSAVEGAKRLKWLGKDSDTYQLHAFTNGSGDRSYGVAITTREEIYCGDNEVLTKILKFMKRRQNRRNAARIISRSWRRYCQRRSRSEIQLQMHNDGKKNFFSRARHFAEFMRSPSNQEGDPEVDEFQQSLILDSRWSSKSSKSVSPLARRLAAEAFKFMNEAESGGDVCIIENCYVMIGTKPEEQSLIFCALQKIVDVEREDKSVRMRFDTSNAHAHESTSLQSETRNAILHAMQTRLCLSSDHIKSSFSRGKDHSSFEVDLSLGFSSKISLPLPLPHISCEWGLATLVRCIKVRNILIALKLLLMERSILLIGTSVEEVSASACAMLELLKPYKWASAFMPLLPVHLLDIVESPVPFIGGIVLNDKKMLDSLEHDERIKNAMREGMSIINLTSKSFSPTSEDGINDFMRRCYDPISHTLLYYQTKLERLTSNKNSSLNSFKSYFQSGASPEEAKVLSCMRDIFEDHFQELSCMSKPDDYKEFGVFDPGTGEFDFFPDKFLEPLRAQLEFQEAMISTQLFLSYIEEKKNKLDLLEGPAAKFIADWVYWKWKKHQTRKTELALLPQGIENEHTSSL